MSSLGKNILRTDFLLLTFCYHFGIIYFCFEGVKLKVLVDAAENYHTVLAENRKLYNEVLELKGTYLPQIFVCHFIVCRNLLFLVSDSIWLIV